MDEVDLDVVIPAWGTYTATLQRCIDSIPNQVNIIVAGDENARRIALANNVTHVLTSPDLSVGEVREMGKAQGRAKYLCFIDADDEYLEGSLERLVRALERDPRLIAAVACVRRDSDGKLWPPVRIGRRVARWGGGYNLLLRNQFPTTCACVIRRERIGAATLFPRLEDEDWHAAVALRARGPIMFLPFAAVTYHVHEDSISHRPRDESKMKHSEALLLRTALAHNSGFHLHWRVANLIGIFVRRRNRRRLLMHTGHS